MNKPEAKEMLSYSNDGNKVSIKINYSSLSLIYECMRKTDYTLNQKLKSEHEPEALTFGSSIHKALEHWYQLPVSSRLLTSKSDLEQAEQLSFRHGLEQDYGLSPLESLRQFMINSHNLMGLADTDKRSVVNGVKILLAYFKHYANDALVVVRDDKGPLIERKFSYPLLRSDSLDIDYFGTIDVVLRNEQTGLILVTDHKTTASLGQQFYSRLKPNHQYTGYILGAREILGLDTNLFMVNGIQVAKTKHEFARQVTERTEEDFQELRFAVYQAAHMYMYAKQMNVWPQNAPNPCSNYGSCSYIDVCSVPNKLKESVIDAKWSKDAKDRDSGAW